jgi:hypothetical protein
MSEQKRSAETIIHENGDFFTIHDPLLEPFPLKKGERSVNGLVADIIQTPLGQRALDITQLSKAEAHATIPGTHRFHRLGHIVGLAEMTRRLAEIQGATRRQTDAYVMYASFSDLAHGPFSHATDIAVQGVGSNETYHESRVAEAFALGGVRDVFEDRGLKVNLRGELRGVPIPPWVESSSPDVCVDRLQYTLHEMLLWFDGSKTPEADQIRTILADIASLKNIEIDDEGRMIFTDIEQARLLAKGYSLLSTEHWNDPVNRVQLYLLIESLKYSILNRHLPGMDEMDNGNTRKPLDYLYAIDSDVLKAMESEPGKTDPYLYAIEGQLADIGREEQRRFVQFKRRVYEKFLTDPRAEEYPSQILHPGLVDFGPGSSHFEINRLTERLVAPTGSHPQVPQLTGENGDLHYTLFPLKNRRIDPLVKTDKGVKRLSEIDRNYAELIRQHQLIQRSSLSVHIPTTSIYKDLLWRQAEEISAQFSAAQQTNPPLDKDPKRRSIEEAAARARAHAIDRGVYIDGR